MIESKENYYLFESRLEKMYVYSKDNNREVGDYLIIKGYKSNLDFEVLESGFDFKTYLNKKGVNYQLNVIDIEIKFQNPIKLKSFRESFLSKLNPENSVFVSTLFFSNGYEGEVIEILDNLQLNRLFSSGGIFLYAVYIFFNKLLLMITKKKKISNIITISILGIYGIITFFKFTVIRFVIMKVLDAINRYVLKSKFKYLTLLSFSALIFIIVDFHIVYSDSFLLCYLIPFVVYFIRAAFKDKNAILQKVYIGISIFVLFIPFALKFNNSINLTSYVLMTILSPLFIVMFIINFLGLLYIPIYPISNFLFSVCKVIVQFISKFKIEIYGPPMGVLLTAIFIFYFIVFFYYYTIRFHPIYKKMLVIGASALTLYFTPIKTMITCEVSFINVGQGDCCLIRKGNTSILVDTGGSIYKDIARDNLIPYLKKKQIYDIDYIFITHDDLDHSGALNSLCKNFKVKNVIREHSFFPISISGITFYDVNSYQSDDKNDGSINLYFNFLKKDFLLMGDSSIKVEKHIMKQYKELDCDVIKIGHHGSDTSTSDEFIKFVSPEVAIISVGKNNYGHPDESVLKILENNNVTIKRTDEMGTITYSNYIFM